MDRKLTEKLVGSLVFLYALILYGLTVAPTASFWDCGEFIAISNRLQVSHPPGAPFYMLVGRVVSMFVPTAYVSLSINLISVVASAFTVLFAYLIVLHLVEEFRGDSAAWSSSGKLVGIGGSAVGALVFAATDSFWFNAVEAEVYAPSMFFTAVVVWLIMKWAVHIRKERAGRPSDTRFGFGPVTSRYLVLIAYLFGLATGIHLLNVLAIFFIAMIVFFDLFDRDEWTAGQRFKGLLFAGVIASLCFFAIYPGVILWLPEIALALNSVTVAVAGIAAVLIGLIVYSQRNRMRLVNLAAISFAVILIGYSTYALIFIRSAADPPIDENDPENLEAIVSYLKREQYGSTPLFPRMHSAMPEHQSFYARYDSEFEFFMDYQVYHMYIRYFLWNFAGRDSDIQDTSWSAGFNRSTPELRSTTPSERATANYYYGLPLLIGLIGAVYHFRNDWRRASSVGVLFLLMGLGIIFYLNQTPLQPRERDYSFVGSFFAFSLWIGVGAVGILEWFRDTVMRLKDSDGLAQGGAVVGLVALLCVPAWMTYVNYDDHDRSGRYVATDYAYNLLMSLEPNAVVFTNGDNDTFPLWYLQEVEGVRQDVRVVCLSLLNTPWYIRQLKNQWSRDSAPIPMSFTEEEIERIAVVGWQPREISLPVRRDEILRGSEVPVRQADFDLVESPMVWTLNGRPYSQDLNVLYVADQAALDMIIENARLNWERPIYFANTTSTAGQLNLQEYFQSEGLAYRVVPIKHNRGLGGRVVPEIATDRLTKFKFTGLDDPNVHFDENIRRMVDNYRITYSHAARELASAGRVRDAGELLDQLYTKVPFDNIAGDLYSMLSMAQAYELAGRNETVAEIISRAEPFVLEDLRTARSARDIQRVQQFIRMVQYAYVRNGDFAAAADFSGRLADVTGDSAYRQSADQLRAIYGELNPGSTSEQGSSSE